MKFYFKDRQFKFTKWLWAVFIIILGYQIYCNITNQEMLKDNTPTEWEANGKGYHK